ncbi:chaperonin GroEL, partial [Candidatus Peregrinibacteria bacterium]|nr:chaperonin GroEL [Candidatus Peregrinibacteria bacterium]
SEDDDETTGINIIKSILSAPLMMIAENAGKDGAVILDKVINSKDGVGYDASKDQYVDMVEKGIIDPKMVVRSAIENAASVAAIFLTMEGAISDIPEEKKESPAEGGAPGMGAGMPGMM